MKYMVMECHKSFAIVLDEDGNFLKVANLRYQVGQTVYDVIEMNTSKNEETIPKVINLRKLAYAVAAMAACFSLFSSATSCCIRSRMPVCISQSIRASESMSTRKIG